MKVQNVIITFKSKLLRSPNFTQHVNVVNRAIKDGVVLLHCHDRSEWFYNWDEISSISLGPPHELSTS